MHPSSLSDLSNYDIHDNQGFFCLADNSLDSIAVLKKHKIVYVNPAFCELWGLQHDHWIGENIQQVLSPEDKADFINLVDLSLQKMKTLKGNVFSTTSTSGNPRRVQVVLCPDIYRGEHYVHAIFRDITEQEKAEELFLQHEKLSAVAQLAAGIAHDIKNPLTTLKGFVDLLIAGIGNKETYLEIMKNEITQIERVSKELMMLAKPSETNFKHVNMIEIIENVTMLLDTEAFKQNVKIFKSLPHATYVNGDETHLKQVILNLVKNAIEAINDQGKILLHGKIDGNYFVLHISDNGSGIPEEQLQNLGKPFFTTKETGNGLGLMMCYRIIDNHNGQIDVKSTIGEGTEFIIKLPFIA
ncbi:ATP-binding protein [Bacillus sp. PS06]|uniref:ATP-binding protein n=1 Tax=Bacillus sp. PS06 TaxID=2764176 RepID=UPI001782F1E8|nr:ATP-binding protein [Bacillus sp. PS06]MBD8070160.1 PAS domain S-box protein [Bacillus sp. PS06]